MQPASDDTEDNRVVMTPVKNNDGELGARKAWARKAGWFEPVTDFNFEDFDGSGAKREAKVREEHFTRFRGWQAAACAQNSGEGIGGARRGWPERGLRCLAA